MDSARKIAPSDLVKNAIEAALEGAKVARAIQLAGLKPRQKSADADDLVTEGDEAAQNAILDILLRSRGGEAVAILAEEKTAPEPQAASARWRWVVDPIDGTLPYSRGEYFWCVSIALQEKLPSGIWESRIGVLYQASPEDDAEILRGKLFWAETGSGTFLHDLATVQMTKLGRPRVIEPRAEFCATGEFAAWGAKEFARLGIATQFRRSICHATTELLLGHMCAVVQDAGPLEWDVAAIIPIAREAGAQLHAVRMDEATEPARYAIAITWDHALLESFGAWLDA